MTPLPPTHSSQGSGWLSMCVMTELRNSWHIVLMQRSVPVLVWGLFTPHSLSCTPSIKSGIYGNKPLFHWLINLIICCMELEQWNTFITNMLGNKFWPLIIMRYVAFNLLRVCFVHKLFIWDLGARGLYIVLEPFLLRGIPLFYTDQSS